MSTYAHTQQDNASAALCDGKFQMHAQEHTELEMTQTLQQATQSYLCRSDNKAEAAVGVATLQVMPHNP